MKTTYESDPTKEIEIDEILWSSEALLDRTDEINQGAIRALYHRHWGIISTAPGSSYNHQFWPGGYLEHVRQVNSYVVYLYNLWTDLGILSSLAEEERFTVAEALTVSSLHDIEKPFRVQFGADGRLRVDGRLQSKM